jgi:hypothetical protein
MGSRPKTLLQLSHEATVGASVPKTSCTKNGSSTPRAQNMPKFFFNLTNGGTVRDERGTDCTGVEQAKEFAVVVAAELGRNRLPKDIQQLAVFVTDETGSEIFRTKLANQQEQTSADESSGRRTVVPTTNLAINDFT